MMHRTLQAALGCYLIGISGANLQAQATSPFQCKPLTCSSLIPTPSVDDQSTNDCAYRAGNLWWVDYVAGSLTWRDQSLNTPVVVAVFDDGAYVDHEEIRNQLWTNEAEAKGKAGADDDGNGYVDDVHGWDFVDDSPDVSPKGECRSRNSHGTFMASLVAGQRNNGVGIAAPGSDGARLMILRVVGCKAETDETAQQKRLVRALDYATRMGARILRLSWNGPKLCKQID